MDGSSHIDEEKRQAGYTVVTLMETVESWPLPQGTLARRAELILLTNIYTDLKYVFLMLHVYRTLYRERGLHVARGKEIKYP